MADRSPERALPRDDELVIMGRVSGLFGVKGWVKVFSHARPRESIIEFGRWFLRSASGWEAVEVLDGRRHGNGVVARLAGIEDRDQAEALLRREIAVLRGAMPATDPDEYYWVDLIGLRVETLEGRELGKVTGLLETGANDVMVVQGERERMLPFVQGRFVKSVNLDAGLIVMDWDPDF